MRKLYYDENVYRVSKRNNMFREIKQAGLECIGKVDGYHLGEVVSLAAASLASAADDYVLAVSDLDILDAFICAASEDEAAKTALLKCVGEKNPHGIDAVGAERDSPAEKAAPLKALVSLYGPAKDVLSRVADIPDAPDVSAPVSRLFETLSVFDPDDGRIQIDFSIVSDLRYYNGIVFKGFIAGLPEGVLSGGQYDRLMRKLGRRCGAVGFAVYLDTLERLGEAAPRRDADVTLVYGENESAKDVAKAVAALVAEGYSVAAVSEADPAPGRGKIFRFENGEVRSLEDDA